MVRVQQIKIVRDLNEGYAKYGYIINGNAVDVPQVDDILTVSDTKYPKLGEITSIHACGLIDAGYAEVVTSVDLSGQVTVKGQPE